MQSELACHIDMCGRHFCRMCYIRGHDAEDLDCTLNNCGSGTHNGSNNNDRESVTSSIGDTPENTETPQMASSASTTTKRKSTARAPENLVQMYE